MSEKPTRIETVPDHLTPRQKEIIDSKLMDTDFQLSDYTIPKSEAQKDFADTVPDAFDKLKSGWDNFDSFHDSQVDTAHSVLENTVEANAGLIKRRQEPSIPGMEVIHPITKIASVDTSKLNLVPKVDESPRPNEELLYKTETVIGSTARRNAANAKLPWYKRIFK